MTANSIRFRTNWRGQMILQILRTQRAADNPIDCSDGPKYQTWEDAKLLDFPNGLTVYIEAKL